MKRFGLFLQLCLCFYVIYLPCVVHAKSEEEYQQEIRMLRKRNTQLENQLEQVTSDLKHTTQIINLLQDQLAQMPEKDGKFEKQSESIMEEKGTSSTEEISSLQTALKTAQEDLEQQKKQFKANVALLHEQEQKLQAAEATIRRMNTQVSSTSEEDQQKIQKLESALAGINTRVVTLSEEKTQLEIQLATLQTILQAAETEQDALSTRLRETEQQNLQFQQDVVNLEQALQVQGAVPEEAKKRIRELEQELQNVKIQFEKQERLQAAFEQTQKELESMTAQNLDLKAALQSKEEAYRIQEQQFQNTFSRNSELEQQEQEERGKIELKEKLLQQALIEKSLQEKTLEEKEAFVGKLTAQLQEAKAQNVLLQDHLQKLGVPQPQTSQDIDQEKSQETSSYLSILQQQLLQEKALQQQLQTELKNFRQQAQTYQQQMAMLNEQLLKQRKIAVSVPTISSLSVDPIRMIFPSEIVSTGTVTVLDWSPDRSKIAYLETHKTQERLWIFDRQTRQSAKITEWPRSSAINTPHSQFAWAFDNHHFLFATGLSGQYLLYLGNSTGLLGQPIQLREQYIRFAWSPKQLQFAYFSETMLIIQHLQGEVLPVQIGHQPGLAETALAWDPDGTRIALCAKRGTNFDIYLLLFSETPPLLQPLVTSPSDDLQPSWSPDGQNIAFYVHAAQYDTKIAVTPINQSRAPYIVGHNVSLSSQGGPRWLTDTELVYIGEEHLSASENSVYHINLRTGQRSSVPITMLFSR